MPSATAPRHHAANHFWGDDWPQARALWRLAPGVRHLNHGAFGAVPLPVRRAQARLRAELDANPMRFMRRELPSRLESARLRAAAFCGADPDGFCFVDGVTAGVEAVLAGVRPQEGDEVVVTEQAYGPVAAAVARACRRGGARRVVAGLTVMDDEEARTEAVLGALTDRTRLVVLEHVTPGTALVLPVARLVAALHERGIPVAVDAAHAPGALPLAVAELGADFWIGAFHKWLCAPLGTAALAVARPWRTRMAPLVSNWASAEAGYPQSFAETGSADPTGRLCVPAAIDFLTRLGPERVRRHNAELAAYGAAVVAEAVGATTTVPGPFTGMRAVALPPGIGTDTPAAKTFQDHLAQRAATETTVVSAHGRGWLRLSAQVYNSPAEYEQLAGRLRRELR
ncbi:aminotransferase class V-fold PLP-dependent enzyme [Streptomyces sp. NPDC004542]|uniref:aminotransferase class V-fold PLP-dependent enzyme n=1 Tax=Streptomyces sp. NPDC004542 TaxID=3154281 RepID=UPI0033A42C28